MTRDEYEKRIAEIETKKHKAGGFDDVREYQRQLSAAFYEFWFPSKVKT